MLHTISINNKLYNVVSVLQEFIKYEFGTIRIEVPSDLKYPYTMFKQLLAEVITKWAGVFCADCENKVLYNLYMYIYL